MNRTILTVALCATLAACNRADEDDGVRVEPMAGGSTSKLTREGQAAPGTTVGPNPSAPAPAQPPGGQAAAAPLAGGAGTGTSGSASVTPTGTRTTATSAGDVPDSIGQANMLPDRTIVLTLRAEGPGGIVGHGQLRYPTSHPRYREVLDHLGGLEPGQTKPVPPWPD